MPVLHFMDDQLSPSRTTAANTDMKSSVLEIAAVFLRLGATAFGGPAAHIAMMEEEVVRRRKWLSQEEFLDLLGATNLIPGPNSTEMAIHVGKLRAGWRGLITAGVCFIFPAFAIVTAIAWAYVKFGTLPQATAMLYGVKPVIIAVVGQALWGFSKTAAKTNALAIIGLIALVLVFAGVNELAVLFGVGTVWGVKQWIEGERKQGIKPLLGLLSVSAVLVGLSLWLTRQNLAVVPFGLAPLFLFFLKVGSVLFGSGYVLLAFLRADLVTRFGWLTSAQLLDATAVGQFTPGPVFTTATFIGYLLGGVSGAVVATFGIFLPAFVFVALSSPLVPRIRKSPIARAFLDGVNIASLALMAAVTYQLGRAAITDALTASLTVIALGLLVRYKVNSAWLVLGGAIIGLLFGNRV